MATKTETKKDVDVRYLGKLLETVLELQQKLEALISRARAGQTVKTELKQYTLKPKNN